MTRPGKELCDILIVCAPDVILWSVKDIALGEDDSTLSHERWQRRAVDESIAQLSGAARQISMMESVQIPGTEHLIALPSLTRRSVHRIAVALGSKGRAMIAEANRGDEHVHVMNESSLHALLEELDTITDFIDYLRAKEAFLKKTQVLLAGGEEELLGHYLRDGRSFPKDLSLLVVQEGIWNGLTSEPKWSARKQADEVSYFWDKLIETFLGEFAEGGLAGANSVDEVDALMRVMARENRFARRLLAAAFAEFMLHKEQPRSRIVPSPSGVIYVLLVTERELARENRKAELMARCWVARGLYKNSTTVVGIATERESVADRRSFDAMLVEQPEWSEADERRKREFQNLGYFSKLSWSGMSSEEFPNDPSETDKAT